MDHKPQHKAKCPEPDIKDSENSLGLCGHEDYLPTLLTQAVRATTNGTSQNGNPAAQRRTWPCEQSSSLQNGERSFTNYTCNRELTTKVNREPKKLDIKKTNNSILKIGYRSKQRILKGVNSNG